MTIHGLFRFMLCAIYCLEIYRLSITCMCSLMPSLGLAWSNVVTSRMMLSKTHTDEVRYGSQIVLTSQTWQMIGCFVSWEVKAILAVEHGELCLHRICHRISAILLFVRMVSVHHRDKWEFRQI